VQNVEQLGTRVLFSSATYHSNKWVLNETSTPLFFLFTQLVIAVVLFVISDVLKLLPDRLAFDLQVCKGLVAMVGLNVVGLRYGNNKILEA
jgi:solute carrier family 35 (GDP-fucose transporter), member C1